MDIRSFLPRFVDLRRRLVYWVALILICLALGAFFARPHFYAWRAERLLDAGSLIRARDIFQQAVDSGCDTPAFHLLRARCFRKLADFDSMSRALETAARQGAPDNVVRLELRMAEAQRGNLDALEPQLSHLLISSSEPDEICDAFVSGCLLKYRLQDALQLLSVWEQDYPSDDRPHFLRGRILEHQVNFDAALKEFRRASELNPVNGPAFYNAGRVLETLKKPDEALKAYLNCAETLGDPRPGWIAAAGCLRTLRRYGEARDYLLMAQREGREGLSVSFRMVGEPAESGGSRLSMELGELAFAELDFQTAVEHFQAVVDVAPANWKVRYQLSQAQRKLGLNNEAALNEQIVKTTRDALESCDPLISVLKRDPGNIEARFNIGLTFLNHISADQGIVWLDSVLDLAPDHQEARKVLADYFDSHQDENPEFSRLAEEHRRWIKDN